MNTALQRILTAPLDACGFFLKQGMVRWLVRWVVDQNAAHNWQNERFARRQYIQYTLHCLHRTLPVIQNTLHSPDLTHTSGAGRHIHKQIC